MYGIPCPYCKDILDPGEKCNCRYENSRYDRITSREKNGQMAFDLNLKMKKEPVA